MRWDLQLSSASVSCHCQKTHSDTEKIMDVLYLCEHVEQPLKYILLPVPIIKLFECQLKTKRFQMFIKRVQQLLRERVLFTDLEKHWIQIEYIYITNIFSSFQIQFVGKIKKFTQISKNLHKDGLQICVFFQVCLLRVGESSYIVYQAGLLSSSFTWSHLIVVAVFCLCCFSLPKNKRSMQFLHSFFYPFLSSGNDNLGVDYSKPL